MAEKLHLDWTAWGVKAQAALNVPNHTLIVIDPSSSVRGPIIYRLTETQTAQLKAIFETTANPRQDVYHFIDRQKLTMYV